MIKTRKDSLVSQCEVLANKLKLISITYKGNGSIQISDGMIKNLYKKGNRLFLLLSDGVEIPLDSVIKISQP